MENTLESIGLGKPTIVEKPLTHDLGEALEIYKAAQAAGVTVLTGMHFRLTPPFMSINEGVQRGDVGPVTSIESNYVHDMGRVKVGAEWRKKLGPNGFLYEGAAHPLDLNMWIAGQPVNEVQATFGSRKMRPEFNWREDYAITLTYADGTLGRVWSNAAAPMPIHGAALAVYGGDGVYAAHNKYPELKYYRDGDRDWTVTPTAEIGQTIRPMAELFHGYLRGERDTLAPMPTLEEAIGVMIVLNTVEVAAASGQTEKVPSLQEVLARQ
jgi:predicted dehydrogenase